MSIFICNRFVCFCNAWLFVLPYNVKDIIHPQFRTQTFSRCTHDTLKSVSLYISCNCYTFVVLLVVLNIIKFIIVFIWKMYDYDCMQIFEFLMYTNIFHIIQSDISYWSNLSAAHNRYTTPHSPYTSCFNFS